MPYGTQMKNLSQDRLISQYNDFMQTTGLILSMLLALAMNPQDQQGIVNRETMWPAPTAQDWQRPVLITFQRNWEDALAVAQENNQPILICVNMDGEVASEHYAGIRYRQPEIAALYEPYVAVIASVYRHNERDYDENGHRILCPRFGSVTCSEHIAMEPILFEKFFDGKRIAPRHIMIELNGEETYDVYYAYDTDSVFRAIQDGMQKRSTQATPLVRGDRSVIERVISRDVQDRREVERAYQTGNKEQRRALLEMAAQHPDTAPIDLLRLAVFDMDLEMNQLARAALSKSTSNQAVELIQDALQTMMTQEEHQALTAALERLGKNSTRARTLIAVNRGLGNHSTAINPSAWNNTPIGGATYAPLPDPSSSAFRLVNKDQASTAKPNDPMTQLELAEATLDYARANNITEERYSRLLYEDALQNAQQAEKLGVNNWRLHAAIAVASYNLGNRQEAQTRAELAIKDMPEGDASWNSMWVLGILAETRWQTIRNAILQKQEWPPQLLSDVHAAYNALAQHPFGTAEQIAMHFDILHYLGATAEASRVLKHGLTRFPDSWMLHDRLRQHIRKQLGVDGFETFYASLLSEEQPGANTQWYAGYALFVAAEHYRRRAQTEKSLIVYERAITHFTKSIEANPEVKATADHYITLAHAGRARLAYEQENYPTAVTEILAAVARNHAAVASPDGFNISPMDTATLLLDKLKSTQQTELVQKLEAALNQN